MGKLWNINAEKRRSYSCVFSYVKIRIFSKGLALEKKKDVYAIFDDGAIVYDRKLFKIKSYGNVIKFNKNE